MAEVLQQSCVKLAAEQDNMPWRSTDLGVMHLPDGRSVAQAYWSPKSPR
jgi:hypothetical protein